MRSLFAIVLALVMIACGDGTTPHVSGESPEMIMIAINERGDIFLSTESSSLSMDELPKEIEDILGDGKSYRFVIQSEVNGGSFAKEIEEMLHSKGVKKRNVAVSRSVP